MSALDTHDPSHLFQSEAVEVPTVHVHVDNMVRSEEMPTENAYGKLILGIGREPVPLVGSDSRRGRLILAINPISGNHFVCIAHTEGQARAFSGMLLYSPNAITRYEFRDRKRLWVCPGLMTVTANRLTFGPSTTEMLVTWSVEQWSR